jgi:hypothetical protein
MASSSARDTVELGGAAGNEGIPNMGLTAVETTGLDDSDRPEKTSSVGGANGTSEGGEAPGAKEEDLEETCL